MQTLEENVVVAGKPVKAEIEAQHALTRRRHGRREELYRRQINGLADMLRYVPGVWADRRSRSEEVFFESRGSNLDATDYEKEGITAVHDGLPGHAGQSTRHATWRRKAHSVSRGGTGGTVDAARGERHQALTRSSAAATAVEEPTSATVVRLRPTASLTEHP